MARLIKKHSKAKGLQPGHVVFIGQKKVEKPRFRIIDYTRTELKEVEADSVEDCFPYKDTPSITWINIDGLHDVSVIEKIGAHFGIHPLILEDIANTGQRPKLEIGDSTVFLSIKMLYLEPDGNAVIAEQFSCIFGVNYIISFQERVGDVFEPVRVRLRKKTPREKFLTTDYLAYALVDAVADHYFVVLEDIAARIESLEDVLIDSPKPHNLEVIHDLKRQLIIMRKATWPLREVISGMDRADTDLFQPGTKPYIRDVYEHTVQVIDTVETFRDMVSGLLDIYLSSVSNKMNEVMKVLTIIATIFIPLGFLAGVYGMNFDTGAGAYNMPELGLPYGYLLFWGLALAIGLGLLLFFRKKGWI
jgi:magnesium transporter